MHIRLRWRGQRAFVGLLSAESAELDVARVPTKMFKVQIFARQPHSPSDKGVVVEHFRQRWLPDRAARRIEQAIHAALPFRSVAQMHRTFGAIAISRKTILNNKYFCFNENTELALYVAYYFNKMHLFSMSKYTCLSQLF